ncbi:MAG TPA: hypothetical protein PK916_08925 [Bacteroidota bacterium]|nr:hypothetical protein [Bacteroidota bacterium]
MNFDELLGTFFANAAGADAAGGDPPGKGARSVPVLPLTNQAMIGAGLGTAYPASENFKYVPTKSADPAKDAAMQLWSRNKGAYGEDVTNVRSAAARQAEAARAEEEAKRKAALNRINKGEKPSGANSRPDPNKFNAAGIYNSMMRDLVPTGSTRWGQTSVPYGAVMTAAYGDKNAKLIIESLKKLYENASGGALASLDITKPTKVTAAFPANKQQESALAWQDDAGVQLSMPKLDEFALWQSEYPDQPRKNAVGRNLSDTVREELIHQTETDANHANKFNDWNIFTHRNNGNDYTYASYKNDAIPESAFTEQPLLSIDGVPHFSPFIDSNSPGNLQLYPARAEEARAKLVKVAQSLGYHPLLHERGIDAGVDALISKMTTKAIDEGLIRRNKAGVFSFDFPKNSPSSTQGDLRDLMYYLYKVKEAENMPGENGPTHPYNRMREFMKRVFLNWAEAPTQNPDANPLGINLPRLG